MNSNTKKIVMAALMAALTCVATMIIKIPSPLKGYLNLGDCVVLTAGWMLSPLYGFLAAGIGSALADMFSGYIIYAPATFAIKGCMALIAFFGFKYLHRKTGDILCVRGFYVWFRTFSGEHSGKRCAGHSRTHHWHCPDQSIYQE